MNILDKVIGFIDPKAGAARAAYRARIEVIEGVRKYEAASQGRRLRNWQAPATDANIELAAELPRLRNRSRDLRRNNALAAAIVSKHADYLVGSGIKPTFKLEGSPDRAFELQNAFDLWAAQSDPEGRMDYYGQQHAAAQQMVEGGEAFARQRVRRTDDPLLVPMQIQILESDLVDIAKTETSGRNIIYNGIEYDKVGRRRGYYVFEDHPGSGRLRQTEPKFIRADQMVHLYEPQRTQNRGAPWLSPVMVDLRELQEYNQAELVRKKIESCNVAVVLDGDDAAEDPLGEVGDGTITDANGNPIERFEPGMILYARGGRDVRFNTPAISAGIEAYIRTRQRDICAGARIPYELATGDYSNANFASGKLGILAYQRFVTNFQWNFLIPQFCQPTIRWFLNAAVISGIISEDEALTVKVTWDPPEFESIDRLEDAKADLAEVRMGKRSLKEIVSKTGRNIEDVVKEFAEVNSLLDADAVVLDSDPRKMSGAGQLHNATDQAQDTTEKNPKGKANGTKAPANKPARPPVAKPKPGRKPAAG